jgi:hypothetical protein
MEITNEGPVLYALCLRLCLMGLLILYRPLAHNNSQTRKPLCMGPLDKAAYSL